MKKTTKVTTKEYDENDKLIKKTEVITEEEIKDKYKEIKKMFPDTNPFIDSNPNINPMANPLMPYVWINDSTNPNNRPTITFNVEPTNIEDLAQRISDEMAKNINKSGLKY